MKQSLTTMAKLFCLLITLTLATASMAQGPGGEMPGPRPGGHPGGSFHDGPRGDRPRDMRQMQNMEQRSSTVKQKRHVTEGSTFKVVGSFCDSVSKEPLAYMNVAILYQEDSTFLKGTSTNLDGYFEIAEIPAGNYILRASYIGYQNRMIPFTVENNTALGTLKLKPGAATMKEVTITAERPLYSMDGEKMIYNVEEDPTIQSGTTNDALQNAPGVEVDIEGNISLRGVSSVEIWVNDKPSKLTEENLKTYLETLPANALARIETITNPSAKYATEAEAVINIITSAYIKSNHFLSFGVNAASQPNVSPWASYSWANERLTINGHISGRFSRRESEGSGWSVTRTGADTNNLDTIMRQVDSSTSLSKNYGLNFSLNMSYEIDSMSDVSAWISGNGSWGNSASDGWMLRDQNFSGGNIYEYTSENQNDSRRFFSMFGGDYTHKFNKDGHNLRVSLFGNMSSGENGSANSRIYTQTDSDPRNQSFYKYNESLSHDNSVSLNARYNRPYSQDGDMSYGFGYRYSSDNSDYRPYLLDDVYTEEMTLDPALYDLLRRYVFEEQNHELNGDAEWTHRWGGFTLELGLGAAYTNNHFAYSETSYTDDTTYNFLTFNPSIHLSYRTKEMHNYKLNYSLRMRNPNASNLSTYKHYTDDSWSTGNRDLHQSYTHNAEAGWTKFFERFGSVGLEAYGRLSTGEIDNLTDVTEETDPIIGRIVNYTMPYNIGTSWRYGTSANVMYRPSGFINFRLYANLYNYGYHTQFQRIGNEVENSKWSYSIRLNGWAKIFQRYQVHVSANYTSPTIGLMRENSARYFVNCGVRADFFKRKLSAFINIQDIFNWGYKIGSGGENTNPYYRSGSTNRSLNSRFISGGITFRFGKMELERNTTDGSEAGGPAQE